MFKLDLTGAAPKWHNFPENSTDENRDCRLKIQLYPTSKSQTIMRRTEKETLEVVLSGNDRKEAFCYSLVGAEGIEDSTGKPIKLTEKIKEYIYDYEFKTGIPAFVLKKAGLIIEEVKSQEKNSEDGPNGSLQNP